MFIRFFRNDNEKVSYDLLDRKNLDSLPLESKGSSKGRLGLKDIKANFMSSTLQCLAHTEDLNKYFLFGLSEYEVNKTRYKEIVDQFYFLLERLWMESPKNEVTPIYFKNAFVNQFPQYSNESQDTHEFLASLLDCLHFELNRSKLRVNYSANELNDKINQIEEDNKNKKTDVDQEEDAEISTKANSMKQNKKKNNIRKLTISLLNETHRRKMSSFRKFSQGESIFKQFKEKEDSILVDLFYGQYISLIQCNECKNVNENFEQFNMLHLSIPEQKYSLNILFIPFQKDEISDTFFFTIFEKTTLKTIKDQIIVRHPSLNSETIEAVASTSKKVVLFRIDDKDEVWSICVTQRLSILFFEKGKNESNSVFYYISESNDRKISEPFRLSLGEDIATIAHIEEKIKDTINYEVCDITKLFHNYSEGQCEFCDQKNTISCNLNKDTTLKEYIDKRQECIEKRQDAIDKKKEGIERKKAKVPVLSFIIEMPATNASKIKTNYYEMIIPTLTCNKNNVIFLEDCLEYFSLYEEIEGWNCPKCQKVMKIGKYMKISIPPKHLIIQLKRFLYNATSVAFFKNKKVDTLVQFPLNDFNLRDYLIYKDKNVFYELYAIINHYSFSITSGNYVAICKVGNQWISFDNGKVKVITNEKDLITKDAYLLFYKHKENV